MLLLMCRRVDTFFGGIPISDLIYSDHAQERMAERGFSREDVDNIKQYGKREHRHGAIHYWMQKKRIPDERQADNTWSRLNGVRVVICTCDQCVITVYREDRKRMHRKYAPDHQYKCAVCGRQGK